MSDRLLIISASCSKFGTFAFNTVRWWRKLGEVENECTLHIFGSFCLFLPKIIEIGGNLMEVLTKTNLLSFFGTRCTTLVRATTRDLRLIVGYCAVDARWKSNDWQSAERATACWGWNQCRYGTQFTHRHWQNDDFSHDPVMHTAAADASASTVEQRRRCSRGAPFYWCLAEDGWIASSYVHYLCALMDAVEGHMWLTVCWSHTYVSIM